MSLKLFKLKRMAITVMIVMFIIFITYKELSYIFLSDTKKDPHVISWIKKNQE